MDKKTKAKELLARLDAYEARRSGAVSKETENLSQMLDRIVEDNIASVRTSIKNDPMIRAMEDIQNSIKKLGENSQMDELMQALQEAMAENESNLKNLSDSFEGQVRAMRAEMGNLPDESQVEILLSQINSLRTDFAVQASSYQSKESLIQSEFNRVELELESLSRRLVAQEQNTTAGDANEATKTELVDVRNELDDLRKKVMSSLATIQGGGNANRNFTLNGSSVLTKYTDIDIVPGTNMTIVATTDDVKGTTKLTFNSSGGGGGGGGSPWATPTGTVNSTNKTFGVSYQPSVVASDGMIRVEGFGYSYSAPNITMDIAPADFIRYQ